MSGCKAKRGRAVAFGALALIREPAQEARSNRGAVASVEVAGWVVAVVSAPAEAELGGQLAEQIAEVDVVTGSGGCGGRGDAQLGACSEPHFDRWRRRRQHDEQHRLFVAVADDASVENGVADAFKPDGGASKPVACGGTRQTLRHVELAGECEDDRHADRPAPRRGTRTPVVESVYESA